jgi:hypothetical protein
MLAAMDRVQEVDLQGVLEVRATPNPTSTSTSTAAAAEAKDVAEEVREVAVRIGTRAEPLALALASEALVTVLIISPALVGIREHAVGLGGLLEAVLRIGIIRISVRMVLHGELSVGLLELRIGSGPRDTQDLVIVTWLRQCILLQAGPAAGATH